MSVDEVPVAFPPLTTAVLVRLLMARGKPLPIDRLFADVWGEPRQRLSRVELVAVQKRIVELRAVLGRETVVTDHGKPTTYRLNVDAAAVDAFRFEAAVERGEIDGALKLWREPPLLGMRHLPFAAMAADQWIALHNRLLDRPRAADDSPHKQRDGRWHDELYQQYGMRIKTALTRILVDRANAEDLTQNTFMIAWTKRHKIPDGAEVSWLFDIAKELAMRDNRAQRKRAPQPFDPDAPSASSITDDDVHTAFGQLPAGDLKILQLYYLDDLDFNEIAKLLAIKPATARKRLERALYKAKALLPDPYGSRRR